MSEPTTEAGRRLADLLYELIIDTQTGDPRPGPALALVAEVEVEARASLEEEIERLERALQACEEAP